MGGAGARSARRGAGSAEPAWAARAPEIGGRPPAPARACLRRYSRELGFLRYEAGSACPPPFLRLSLSGPFPAASACTSLGTGPGESRGGLGFPPPRPPGPEVQGTPPTPGAGRGVRGRGESAPDGSPSVSSARRGVRVVLAAASRQGRVTRTWRRILPRAPCVAGVCLDPRPGKAPIGGLGVGVSLGPCCVAGEGRVQTPPWAPF